MKIIRTMRDLRRLRAKRLAPDTFVRVKNRRTDRTYVLNATKNHDTITAITYPRIGLTPEGIEAMCNAELSLSSYLAIR